MKITVLGAGAIGSAIAFDLLQRENVSHVLVVDHKAGALTELATRADSRKLRTAQADVRDARRIASVIAGSACVVSSVTPSLHPFLARLAIQAGAHFCDMGGDVSALQQEMKLDQDASERGKWVVPSCGFAPGLVNMMVVRGIEEFNRVDSVIVRAGSIPQRAESPFFHRFTYAAEKLIEDYTATTPMIKDGETVQVEALTGEELVDVGEPFGQLEGFYTAGKMAGLIHELHGKLRELDYKTLRHPGHLNAIRSVFALGFGENTLIDVRAHLTYRDVLARGLRKQLSGLYDDAVLVRIHITGERNGNYAELMSELTELSDDTSSATQRCTAHPAATVAVMLGSGKIPGGGVAPPERIIPREEFFADLAERGVHIQREWKVAAEA